MEKNPAEIGLDERRRYVKRNPFPLDKAGIPCYDGARRGPLTIPLNIGKGIRVVVRILYHS